MADETDFRLLEAIDKQGQRMAERLEQASAAVDRIMSENEQLRAAGQFLIDRLSEIDIPDELAREWLGHVELAIERFNAVLKGETP